MRLLFPITLATSFIATTALSDGLEFASVSTTFMSGDVSRNGFDGGFEGEDSFSAEGIYAYGPWTFSGAITLRESDFSGRVADNFNSEDSFELEVAYDFGDWAVGFNASQFRATDLGASANLRSGALYGQYDDDEFHIGLAVFHVEDTDINQGDTGFAAFGGYDNGEGFEVGAQISVIDDERFIDGYAAFTGAKFDLEFDFGVAEDFDVLKLAGAYNVTDAIAVVAGIQDVNVGGDGTTNAFLGGRYTFMGGVSAELLYHDLQAFNDFEGQGVSLKITYELGDKKRGGFQSFGASTDQVYEPAFFVF